MLSVKEFRDFSGGITDKNIPGQENLYSVADNMLIDFDKQLFQRGGLDIFSSTAFKLGGSQIVQRLVNFDFDTELLGLQNKNLYYISAGAWTSLLGPTGNNPFNSNVAGSLIEESQWNHQAYFVSNSSDPPIYFYRDGSNNPQVRTLGLPEFTFGIYPLDGGLADAIALVNDIRSKMITHTASSAAGPAPMAAQHITNAALTAQNATLTATVAATNLATLITLLNALRTVLTAHLDDAQIVGDGGALTQAYHINVAYALSKPGTLPLLNLDLFNDSYTVVGGATISQLLPYVNDLRIKWNMHTYATETHGNAYTTITNGFGAQATALGEVKVYTGPIFTKTVSPLGVFLNVLRQEFQNHIGNLSGAEIYHTRVDTDNDISIFSTSSTSDALYCYIHLAHLAFHMMKHVLDANWWISSGQLQKYWVIKGDSTSGNNTLTNCSPAPNSTLSLLSGTVYFNPRSSPGGSPYTWGLDYTYSSNTAPLNPQNATATGATTITMSGTATASLVQQSFVFTPSKFHWYNDANTNLLVPGDIKKNLHAIVSSITSGSLDSVETYADLASYANTLAAKLKTHATDGMTAGTSPLTTRDTVYLLPTAAVASAAYSSHGSNYFYTDFPRVGLAEDYYTTNAPTPQNYLYKFLYHYSYVSHGLTFDVRGTPSVGFSVPAFLSPTGTLNLTGSIYDLYPINITQLPILANTSNQNWDTANITKEVYRTQNNTTTYKKLTSLTNATTSYIDDSPDSEIVSNLDLYTTGGVVPNDAPPAAKHLHILDGVAYYGNILKDTNNDVFPNRLMQSIQDAPYAAPADFFDDFDEEITGLSSTRSNLIVFCKKSVYREEGNFDSRGNGLLRHDRISDQIGCISAPSIVKGESGVFFAGQDGFYYTDGYQILRLTGELEGTFKTITSSSAQKSALQGTYDGINKKVYWIVQSTSALSAPDKMWVLDLQFGIKKDATPITTFSGFTPTAITLYNSLIHYGDSDGYTMKIDDTLNLDVKKNTGVSATLWDKKTIMWDFKSCHNPFESEFYKKYFLRVTMQFKQTTNLSVQPISDADKGRVVANLPIIRSRRLLDWGDSKIDWPTLFYTAKDGNVIDEFRWFKSGSLRSNFRAIELKNAYCVIGASDQMGNINLASLGGGNYTCTLLTAGRKWPLYSVDYYVRIGGTDYIVYQRDSDAVVRINDPLSLLAAPQLNIAFEMWGYPKNEHAHLMSYNVAYEYEGDEEKPYQGVTSLDGGQNA